MVSTARCESSSGKEGGRKEGGNGAWRIASFNIKRSLYVGIECSPPDYFSLRAFYLSTTPAYTLSDYRALPPRATAKRNRTTYPIILSARS